MQANLRQPLTSSVAVKLNDLPLSRDMSLCVTNVAVEQDLEVPGMFTIELVSMEGADGVVSWSDDENLALGSTVEISMGYGGKQESLIIGEITALEPAFTKATLPTLSLRGYDKRHRLNAAPRTRTFVDQKDSDIAAQVCAEAGLSIEAIDSNVIHSYVLQADQTDLEFLQERARRQGYELAMEGATVHFRPVANGKVSIGTLTFDDDLFEFGPRMSLLRPKRPPTEVRVMGWDPKEKQAITAAARADSDMVVMGGQRSAAQHAEAAFGASVETVTRAQVSSQAEADRMAVARLNEAALDFIRADGVARGRPDVRAGRVINVEGLGKRFSGQYYLTSAVHRYSPHGGYRTDFQAKRNAS